MACRTTRERFERFAAEALSRLPRQFTERFTNLSFIVEDRPTPEDEQLTGVPRDELLGMFDGVPVTDQGGLFDLPPGPGMIVLFKRNLEAFCETEEELAEEIRLTVLHEVGHYFGMTEEELLQYE